MGGYEMSPVQHSQHSQHSQYSQYSHLLRKAIPDTIMVIFAKDFSFF